MGKASYLSWLPCTSGCIHIDQMCGSNFGAIEWLLLVGSMKLYVCVAKEPYTTDDILQKRPVI